jgi:hypothetical protein
MVIILMYMFNNTIALALTDEMGGRLLYGGLQESAPVLTGLPDVTGLGTYIIYT